MFLTKSWETTSDSIRRLPPFVRVGGAILFLALIGSGLFRLRSFRDGIPVDAVSGPRIRVLLAKQEGPSLFLDASGGLLLVPIDGSEGQPISIAADRVEFRAEGKHVSVETFSATAPAFRVSAMEPEETVSIGGRSYRGKLVVYREPTAGLQVVNELAVEHYLRGVIGSEMPARFPLAALEAQAVVSRTYALRSIERNRSRNEPRAWDVTDDSSSQMYRGTGSESLRTDDAVLKSQGQVLCRNGKMVDGFYHSSCGGTTSEETAVFSAVIDPDLDPDFYRAECASCQESTDRMWSVEIPTERMREAIRSLGIDEEVRELISGTVDRGGRWIDIQVRTDAQLYTIPANRFRLALGSSVLKSTLIESVIAEPEGVWIKGRGFGHGVGLCQLGARAMGDAGMSCQEILLHYYAGAEAVRAGDRS